MGQTTEYQYDNENQLIGVTLPAVTNPATGQLTNPTYEYGYDANGNQTSLTDPNGGVTTFTYDAQGNATVHAPESNEGAGRWSKWAWTASATKAKTLRDCWRQVSTTVSIVSTKRLPGRFGAERELPPDDRVTQGALAGVVGRLDPLDMQKRPQPLPMVVQFPTHAHQPWVAADRLRAAASFHLLADRVHQPLQSGPGDRAVAVARPKMEQFPRGPHQVASQPFHLMVRVIDQRLEVPLQVGPAPLQAPSCQYIFARSHVTTPLNRQ